MKACSSASGGVFFIPEKLDRKNATKAKKSLKIKKSNDNRGKKEKILK